MSTSKWYKLKSRNFTGVSSDMFAPPGQQTEEGQSWLAKGPESHCLAIKQRLVEVNYPGELYMEECKCDGKIYPKETDLPDLNKEIVARSKDILKKLGYDVKTGHLYELFSQLSGFKSWNVAKARDVEFVQNLTGAVQAGSYYSVRDEGCTARILRVEGNVTTGLVYFHDFFYGKLNPAEVKWDAQTGKCLSIINLPITSSAVALLGTKKWDAEDFDLEEQIPKNSEFFAGVKADGSIMSSEEFAAQEIAYNKKQQLQVYPPRGYRDVGNSWHYYCDGGAGEFYGLTDDKNAFLKYLKTGILADGGEGMSIEDCPFPSAIPFDGGMHYYLPNQNLPAGKISEDEVEDGIQGKIVAMLNAIRARVE